MQTHNRWRGRKMNGTHAQKEGAEKEEGLVRRGSRDLLHQIDSRDDGGEEGL